MTPIGFVLLVLAISSACKSTPTAENNSFHGEKTEQLAASGGFAASSENEERLPSATDVAALYAGLTHPFEFAKTHFFDTNAQSLEPYQTNFDLSIDDAQTLSSFLSQGLLKAWNDVDTARYPLL